MRNRGGRAALARLLSDNRRYWPGLIELVLLMLFSGVLKSFAADFFGDMVGACTEEQFSAGARFGALTIGMYFLDGVRLAFFNSESVRVVNRLFLQVKKRLFEVVARSRLSDFERSVRSGDAVSRITDDVSRLQSLFSETYCWLISVFFRGLVALLFCLRISWRLSIVYLVILPVTIALMNRIGKPIGAQKKRAAKSGGRAYSVLTEVMNNLTTVKAYRAEEKMDQRFARAIDEKTEELIASDRKAMALSFTSYLGDVVQLGLIFLLGVLFIMKGWLTIGALVSFVALTGSIREAFELAEKGISSAREGGALASRLYEIFDLPAEPDAEGEAEGEPLIEMEGLTFAYQSEPVLKNISLKLSRGDKVAFVGPSGCGKSTLVKLICKLYDGYDGRLTLFGRDAGRVKTASVRGRVAMVSQDPYLFGGSFAANVRYGNERATDEQVIEALKAVRVWEDIKGQPEGVDTPIGDFGSRLSGGQKQRLSIARALVRGADLILLDEATSALDTQTESEIQDMLGELFADKTVAVIAHRYAALRDVQWVYCMDRGRITARGLREVLLKENEYLRRMASGAIAEGGRDG